jgi:hypothetical protein
MTLDELVANSLGSAQLLILRQRVEIEALKAKLAELQAPKKD